MFWYKLFSGIYIVELLAKFFPTHKCKLSEGKSDIRDVLLEGNLLRNLENIELDIITEEIR